MQLQHQHLDKLLLKLWLTREVYLISIKFYVYYLFEISEESYPVNVYLFKVNNRNTRKRCGICSKLTINHQDNVDDVITSLSHHDIMSTDKKLEHFSSFNELRSISLTTNITLKITYYDKQATWFCI